MPVRAGFAAGSARIEVRSTVPELSSLAAQLFPDYAEEPGALRRRVVLEVDGTAGGYRLGLPDGPAQAGSLAEAADLLELALTGELLRGFADHYPLHAGAVLGRGGAMLLPAASGSGKSTLIAALAQRGRAVYGDDIVLIDRADHAAHPFRRLLKLNRDVWPLFGLRPGEALIGTTWPDAALISPRALGGEWAAAARVAWIAAPRYRAAAALSVREMTGGEALLALVSQSFDPAERAAALPLLASLVSGARAVALDYGDLDAAVERVEAMLDDGGVP